MNHFHLLYLSVGSILSLGGSLMAQQDGVNPNIGHEHHLHAYQDKLETVPSGPERFVTSREGAKSLLLPAEKDAFQFVVFGDRTGGPPEGVGVLADAVRDTNLLAPDLVLTVGDLIQGYNNEEKWIPQAKEYKDVMDRLSCPWFPVAGNHDTYWRDAKAGAKRPAGDNDKLFETHFGPLWYAFEHKNSWFIVLYSDEGDAATGKKDFTDPNTQKMSPAQFTWLEQTLAKAKGADHVFLFLHHPRWLKTLEKANYGDDWDRVHGLLKKAGNVSAVFAGHIHQMRSDGPRDGIQYITLATTGGQIPGYGESLGFMHHYDVVTVRKQGISLAAIPVGKVMDPLEMTGSLIAETRKFGEQKLVGAPEIPLKADGSAFASFSVDLENPTSRPVEFTVTGESADSRWAFSPEHRHGKLAPGEKAKLEFKTSRIGSPLDVSFRDPVIRVEADYLAPGFRYRIPERQIAIPVAIDPALRGKVPNRALRFDGRTDFLRVPSAGFDPGEIFTIESRFKADSFGNRTGLVTKTQGSDYGIFVNDARPTFSIFIGDSYLSIRPETPVLRPNTWHHLAGVYDGKEARLYLDGKLIAKGAREGKRLRNDLPLVVGADVDSAGTATSHFSGVIDYVKISKTAAYRGESFTVGGNPQADADTCLLLQLDEIIGLRLLDSSASRADAERCGNPVLEPVN